MIPLPPLISPEELLVMHRLGRRWTQRIPQAAPDYVVLDLRDSHESRLISVTDLERMRAAQRATRRASP
jgi:predicted lysophospholipase L1 biosynthesis ABC-type transport system permease subunit